MMNRWAIVCIVLCLLVAGFQTVPDEAWGEDSESSWVSKIISVQGRVLAKRKGEIDWRPVGLDDTLFAGDQIRVEANSRAGIVLSNDAVLRLDQNTTLVFTEIEQPTTFIFKLLKGAANFFSHRPRSLKIVTPFVNGVVEGTEFYVHVDARRTRIDLFEGRILAQNVHGELQLAKGQGAVASAGEAPQARILVHPRDSVQWALYYPPILTEGPDQGSVEFRDSIVLFNQGRTTEAIDRLETMAQDDRDALFYTYRAGLMLNVGRVNEAREDIQRALAMEDIHSDALALKAVIAVAQNHKDEALAAAEKAVQSNLKSASAQIALSYAHQAAFNLPEALKDAHAAVSNAPDNGTAWARLAELQLSTGELDQGIESAQKAAALNPNVAHAHTILGFAYLTRIKTQKAREAFKRAITLDSAAPLPRLGLGLAKIRDGDLEQGRAQLEIAAGLDPANALIRSYLGKAYFDEKRGPRDEQQFETAKELDPSDPTPWFYDAIRKQTLNRPVEALQDLQKSIERNDNRAIYRSRLFLDGDLAARSAGLGRIYRDLGFEQLALVEGWKSVGSDQSNYSGHRLLADSYAGLRRHEIARVSELLQSQLLQPINITPVQPQLSESNVFLLEGAGPANASSNEFNPLFVRDRVTLQASGVIGNNETRGDELIHSGLLQKISYSLGQFHYETEGFRKNNDFRHDLYNAFAQISLSPESSIQTEYRYQESNSGDLSMHFDPDLFFPNQRSEIHRHTLRLGFHHQPGRGKDVIASIIYGNYENRLRDRDELTGPGFQASRDSTDTAETQVFSGEVQYMQQSEQLGLIVGAGHVDQDRSDKSVDVETIIILPGPPMINTTSESTGFDARYTNCYLYSNVRPFDNLTLTIGAAYDYFDSPVAEHDKISPKTGLIWQVHASTTLRASWFQSIKRPFASNQTVEPTQIAGFNQFFDDTDGSESERYGLALDIRPADNLYSGIELSWRDTDKPIYNISTGATITEKIEEQLHRAYLYWTPFQRLALSAEYFLDKQERSITSPDEVITHRVPLSLGYYWLNGIRAKIISTYVDQEVNTSLGRDSDQFWIVDTSIGYCLPNRRGIISVGAKNLLDTTFRFEDVSFGTGEPMIPLFQPECLVFAQITLAF